MPLNYGGGISSVFNFRLVLEQWYNMGMFDVLLPALLIFAVVYAILQRSGILGKIRVIDATVAMVISIFVIGNPYVSQLFLPIFSQAGLAIIISLAVLLIMGLFLSRTETQKYWGLIGGFISIILFIWLLGRALVYYGIYIPYDWWIANASWIIGLALVVIVVVVIISTKETTESPLTRPMLMYPEKGEVQPAAGKTH